MDLASLADLVESFRGALLDRYSAEEIKEKVKPLFQYYESHGIERSHHQMWYRGCICENEEGFENLHRCIYPKKVGYGRANFPGKPVLYASWNKITVMSELNIQPGQYVQIISTCPKKGRPVICLPIGEFKQIYVSGRSIINSSKLEQQIFGEIHSGNPEDTLKKLFIDSFLAEAFKKDSKSPTDYKLTAAFADHILSSGAGIMYPSVQLSGGINLAISAECFDKNFQVVSVELIKILESFGYGVHKAQLVKSSTKFGDDGKIIWSEGGGIKGVIDSKGGFRISDDFKGWSVENISA